MRSRFLFMTGVVWLSVSLGGCSLDVMPLRAWSRPRRVLGHVFTMWRLGPFKLTLWR